MRIFSNPYKSKNTGQQTGGFLPGLLQWLRLLVLSFIRIRSQLSGIFFHEPDNPGLTGINSATITTPQIITNQKLPNMKPAQLLIKWGIMLLFTVFASNAMAQTGPYA